MHGAGSAFDVWVNGQHVGFSKVRGHTRPRVQFGGIDNFTVVLRYAVQVPFLKILFKLEKKLRGMPSDMKPTSMLITYAVPRCVHTPHDSALLLGVVEVPDSRV
eukprot:16404-Eustigmatos_ZCMA.PRE.1